MLGWFLRIAVIVLLARALWRFLASVAEGGAAADRSRRDQQSVRLVRDPVCGTYVPRSRALTDGRGDETQFFCSEGCRTSYRRTART